MLAKGIPELFYGEEIPQEALRRKAEKKYQESLRKQQIAKKSNNDSGISRRGFLKVGALVAGAALTGYGLEKVASSIGKKIEEENIQKKVEAGIDARIESISNKEELTQEELEEFEFGEIKLNAEDREMMQNILRPDINKKFEVNLELAGVITKYWINKYQTSEKNGMLKAKEEMDKLKPLLFERFRRHGVPEEFMYLAIPESGWKKVKSRAGAEGYYQFMPATAKLYKLKNPNDPLESAEACAKLLKDLYVKTQDWDLALAGYNGGFIWDYLKKCFRENSKPNYPGFLQEIENAINIERKNILENGYVSHKIKKRKNGVVESLWFLSQKYGVSLEDIRRANPSKAGVPLEKTIFVGKNIYIPLSLKSRQAKFREKVSGFIENIQYPPKFNAVIEALEIRPAQYVSRDNILAQR